MADVREAVGRAAGGTDERTVTTRRLANGSRRMNSAQKRIKLAVVRRRDGDLCFVCGEEMTFTGMWKLRDATLEHVLALADGGTNKYENLRLSHKKCNHERGSVQGRSWKPTRLADKPWRYLKNRGKRVKQTFYWQMFHGERQEPTP